MNTPKLRDDLNDSHEQLTLGLLRSLRRSSLKKSRYNRMVLFLWNMFELYAFHGVNDWLVMISTISP